MVVAAGGIKVQLLNYMKETRAAENLLFNVLQPALKIVVDVWSDVVFGHRRLLYQDQRYSTYILVAVPSWLPRRGTTQGVAIQGNMDTGDEPRPGSAAGRAAADLDPQT